MERPADASDGAAVFRGSGQDLERELPGGIPVLGERQPGRGEELLGAREHCAARGATALREPDLTRFRRRHIGISIQDAWTTSLNDVRVALDADTADDRARLRRAMSMRCFRLPEGWVDSSFR